MGKKLQIIQTAFIYMGKPSVFNRILGKYPDMQILIEYARSNTMPALTGGDGIIKTYVLENADTLGLEYVNNGQITIADYDLIKCLSMVVRTEHDYMDFLWLLGCATRIWAPGYTKIWNLDVETEVNMIKFFSRYTSYLFKMAKVRTAFNACGYLTFCNETLVSLGHRISAINNYAGVHDQPNENSSADSFSNSGEKGNVSPRPSGDTVDSAEDSDDDEITKQRQNAEASNAQNVSQTNNNVPQNESETAAKSTQNLTPVIEYEDVSDQIELTNQDIQGIVSLRFERGEINGETGREVLQRWWWSSSDDDEITEQPQNAEASNAQNASQTNNNVPPNESETAAKSTQNLTPVIEYEDVSDQIELTNQDIQGIVSLRFERGEIDGETQIEVLQRLNPTVVLDDVNKEKWERSFWTKISGSTLPIQGTGPLYDINIQRWKTLKSKSIT